jgi:COP9 signalosome complex subunit 3
MTEILSRLTVVSSLQHASNEEDYDRELYELIAYLKQSTKLNEITRSADLLLDVSRCKIMPCCDAIVNMTGVVARLHPRKTVTGSQSISAFGGLSIRFSCSSQGLGRQAQPTFAKGCPARGWLVEKGY